MSEYAQTRREPTATRSAVAQAAPRQAARADAALPARGHAARHDALAESLNRSPRVQSLAQMKQALDASPRVRSQQALQRALNRTSDRAAIQRQALADEEELAQAKFEPAQRQGDALREAEEEEILQGKFNPVQREAMLDEEETAQGRFAPVQRRENRTGLPDRLKAGVESLSGVALDDVRVHYNSAEPATLQAAAYAQGTDIHVGPGQERHLPHEAWHIVQQMQGRVQPTMQAKGVAINDDRHLESEADAMGAQVLRMAGQGATVQAEPHSGAGWGVAQQKQSAVRPEPQPKAVEGTASGTRPVIQRFWFNTGAEIIWLDDENLDTGIMEKTEATHDQEDGNPAGPVWRLKPDEEPSGGEEATARETSDVESVLDTEPVWHEEGPGEGKMPGTVSVKDLTGDVPALIGPTEAWGGPKDFGDLGWDEPLSQARVSRPVYPQVHVTFWCKVGNVDVMVHLTKAGYSLIYRAGDDEEHPERNAPAEKDVDTTKEGLTGKDLYAEFLNIASAAGGYREGANECQTFADSMLTNLTKAVKDANAS